MWTRLLTATLALCASSLLADAGEIKAFLSHYCYECHDSSLQKGERDFEAFELPLSSPLRVIEAKEIIDQLTLQEMPPQKADQPTEAERLEVIRLLRDEMFSARQLIESSGGRTVMRRLSTREYENTLETLFGRRLDTLGLTVGFPKENTSRHMDNIGQSLVTSGFLLDQYFLAADRLVESRLNRPDTEPQTWHFKDNFRQYEELSGAHRAAFKYRYLCLYEQPNTDTRQGGYGHIEDFLQGVPVSGLYDINVLAQAMHRDTHYDPTILRMDLSEPFLLGIVSGDVTKGHIHYPQKIEPRLAAPLVVPDEEPEWLKFRVWLEAGQTPRFIFPNGAYESRASVINLNKRYYQELGHDKPMGVRRTDLLLKGKLPHIRISEIKIHGPLIETNGGVEETSVFGDNGFEPDRALEQLRNFAERAFRRPLSSVDRQQIADVYQQGLADKLSPRLAALDTIKMILCAPSFLYLPEITPEEEQQLRAFDLASRLSYTLWAAPPDEPLMASASDGTLVQNATLEKQIERLIRDENVRHFVDGFLDSWLGLRELGSQPPSRRKAPDYYSEDLPSSMKTEIRQFFFHLLQQDRPITELLDADYTFVDKKLAKLYNLPEKKILRLADGFTKVSLNGTPNRGGLLGMAGVLTVSANGVETSPVTRGVWIAENILGNPPPPPPDEVPPIDTDVRGSTTIRERLQQHRAAKTCAECHRKIDPLGFPLENFDPIGRWRDTYPKAKGSKTNPPIDSTGELPSGHSFSGFAEFKQLLKNHRQDAFARHLITQTLTYATGRHMEISDQFEIEEILHRVKQNEYRLGVLVRICLMSEIVRSR